MNKREKRRRKRWGEGGRDRSSRLSLMVECELINVGGDL